MCFCARARPGCHLFLLLLCDWPSFACVLKQLWLPLLSMRRDFFWLFRTFSLSLSKLLVLVQLFFARRFTSDLSLSLSSFSLLTLSFISAEPFLEEPIRLSSLDNFSSWVRLFFACHFTGDLSLSLSSSSLLTLSFIGAEPFLREPAWLSPQDQPSSWVCCCKISWLSPASSAA